MRKYIINILVFFGIVILIDLCVGFAGNYLQAHAKGGSTKEFNDLVMNDSHDILILGSSRAKHHYDAPFLSDTLGMDVYNAGYDGNGVILADGILELLLKHSHPRLILLDIEPSFDIIVYDKDNNHKRYISDLKPYYFTPEIGDIIKDVSKEEWYKVHSGMIRYNTDIIKIIIDNIITRKNDPKGYSPITGSMLKEPISGIANRHDEIDVFKLKYVSNIIDLAQSNNVPVILVASPKYTKGGFAILTPVIKVCEEKHVPFINYYNHPDFMAHKEWFKEPNHLNSNGARIFSRMIAGDIEKVLFNVSDM
jgi:hypothetical protein